MSYKKRTFTLFVLPSLVIFSFVVLIPFIRGVVASFTNWQSITDLQGQKFIGIENYKSAFEDDKFLKSFLYTIQYTLVAIFMINIVGLSFALLLNKAFKGRDIFRSSFFLPNLIGGLIIGYSWQIVFTKGFESLGIDQWLTTKTNTFWAMEIVTTWQYAGYVMIIFAAALQNIPKDQVEAAKISGANKIRVFYKIVVPNLMPAFTVTLFIALSRAIKVFSLTLSLTNGGINDSLTVAYNIYQTAWQESFITLPNFLGIAQAKSMIFTVFITVLAIIQVRFTKRREIRA